MRILLSHIFQFCSALIRPPALGDERGTPFSSWTPDERTIRTLTNAYRMIALYTLCKFMSGLSRETFRSAVAKYEMVNDVVNDGSRMLYLR